MLCTIPVFKGKINSAFLIGHFAFPLCSRTSINLRYNRNGAAGDRTLCEILSAVLLYGIVSSEHNREEHSCALCIILCDADTAFTQIFEKRLLTVFKKYGITPEIVSAHTGVEALREITCRPTDVLFLDIDMPEKDGFSVAEELSAMPSKPLIIFLSGMEDLVYQSFAFQPFWFLRKTHLEELPQVTEKMLQLLNSRQIHYTVTMNGSSTRIPITEIVYFESQGHYIVVHYNEKSLRFKARMSDIETALSKYFFVRCHVGYLLNCRFVQICSRTSVTLTDGTVLPVSRAKAEETQTAFMAYMRSLRP